MEEFNRSSAVHPTTSPNTPTAPWVSTRVKPRTDPERANQIRQLFYTARSYRKPLVGRWNKAYKTLRGRYWQKGSRQSWMPSPDPPEIFAVIRSEVG